MLVQHQRTADDSVDVSIAVTDAATGINGSVVAGVQVSGRGRRVRVLAPELVQRQVAWAEVRGAPLEVSEGRGNRIEVRLQPDCDRIGEVQRVDLDVPLVAASGRRHVRRIAFAQAPQMLRAACEYRADYGPFSFTSDIAPEVSAGPSGVWFSLRLTNDGDRDLAVVGLLGAGGRVRATTPLPLEVPAHGSALLALRAEVSGCARGAPDQAYPSQLSLHLRDRSGRSQTVPAVVERADLVAAYEVAVSDACR